MVVKVFEKAVGIHFTHYIDCSSIGIVMELRRQKRTWQTWREQCLWDGAEEVGLLKWEKVVQEDIDLEHLVSCHQCPQSKRDWKEGRGDIEVSRGGEAPVLFFLIQEEATASAKKDNEFWSRGSEENIWQLQQNVK